MLKKVKCCRFFSVNAAKGSFLLICLLLGSHLSGKSANPIIKLNYKRINLILPSGHFFNQDQKYIIDSLFAFADRTLQKAESQIGYKTSGDMYFELCFDDLEHRAMLKQTQFWQDHQGTSTDFTVDKTFPIGVYQNYNEIKEDIVLFTNYFLLQEFLGGFGIKQRISNSESRHLPKWLTLGYCAVQASPWSAYDEDEYSYFEQLGAFKKLQSIPARAQLIYGKYIWSQLLKQGNRNTISSFWFIIKFTQSINEAFQFQYHQQFDDWIQEVRQSKGYAQTKERTDVSWRGKLKFQPIIDFAKGKGNDIYVMCYQPDEILIKKVHLGTQKQTLLFKIETTDINNKHKLSQTEIFVDSIKQTVTVHQQIGGLLREFTFYEENKRISIQCKKLTLENCFRGIGFKAFQMLLPHQLWYIDILKNQELIRIGYSKNQSLIITEEPVFLIGTKNEKQYLLKFHLLNHETNGIQTLRIDTLDKPSCIKSIAQESENRYSYSEGGTGVWKLRFIEFAKNEDLTWHTGIKGSFFYHKSMGNTVWETSFDNKEPVIEIFEAHTESKQEIISLIKQSLNKENSVNQLINSDSVQIPQLMPFQFISKFPKRSWERRLNGNLPMYYRGEFQIQPFFNSYYLKHASLQFTNYENLTYGYYLAGKFNQLINNPLTPNLRIEIGDLRSRHLMILHAYSAFTFGRMGLNFDQKIRLSRNVEIAQGFHWRSRNFTISDLSFYRNSLFHSNFTIKRNITSKFNYSLGASFRSDSWYQRLSSLNSIDLKSYRSDILSISWELNKQFQKLNNSKNLLFSGSIQSKISNNYSKQLSLWNQELELQSKIQLNIFKYLNFNSLTKIIHSTGKYKNEYFLGGSTGWISNNQYIATVPPIKNNTPLVIRYWGGNLRGFLIGTRTGSSFFVYNGDILFNIEGIWGSTAEISQFIKRTKIGIWGDAGFAYYFQSPRDLRNPHNTVFTATGNYDLWTSAQRNPWLVSYGFSFHTSLLGLPVKYEYAIPFKQNVRQKNVHLLSLTWDF